jgi:hypothetical protein
MLYTPGPPPAPAVSRRERARRPAVSSPHLGTLIAPMSHRFPWAIPAAGTQAYS